MSKKKNTEAESQKDDSGLATVVDAAFDTDEEIAASEQQSNQEKNETKSSDDSAPKLSNEEKLRCQVEELEDKLLRSAAEFDNYKKRMARRFEDIVAAANDGLIISLLELVDNFERALEHAGENSTEDKNNDALLEGTKLIYNQLSDILRKHEVTPIEAVGQLFDPNLHEALMNVTSEEHKEGIITIEMSKGYRKDNRVIRHSKVGVSGGSKSDNK